MLTIKNDKGTMIICTDIWPKEMYEAEKNRDNPHYFDHSYRGHFHCRCDIVFPSRNAWKQHEREKRKEVKS